MNTTSMATTWQKRTQQSTEWDERGRVTTSWGQRETPETEWEKRIRPDTDRDERRRPVTYMTPLEDAYSEVADESDNVIYVLADSGKLIPATFWKKNPLFNS